MLQYIQGGFAPIPYTGFKKVRSGTNAGFTAWEDENIVVLTTTSPQGAPLICLIDKVSADYTDFLATLGQKDASGEYRYANRPVSKEEIRFQTHDYADKRTWSGETTGYPAAWFAGGVTRHPISGQYVDATGAAMLQAYNTPGDPNYQNPEYLFGSAAYQIEDRYDDVAFKWYDKPLSDATKVELCWLDLSAEDPADHVWRRTSDGAVIVKYVYVPNAALAAPDQDYRQGEWYRADIDSGTGAVSWVYDASHVVTTSIWRLLPYDDYKIEIHEAWLSADVEAVINGPMHYMAYGYVEAGDPALPAGYPSGVYKGRDWDYPNLATFRAGSNTFPMVEPLTLAGHSSPIITMGYDYSKTVYQVIDSRLKQRLDIETDGHVRVSNTFSAKATFVAVKVESY